MNTSCDGLLFSRSLHDKGNWSGCAALHLQLCSQYDMPAVIFGNGGIILRRLSGYKTQRRGMICAAGLSAHLVELLKRELRIHVRVYGNRAHQQKIAVWGDSHMISINRMQRVSQSISAGF